MGLHEPAVHGPLLVVVGVERRGCPLARPAHRRLGGLFSRRWRPSQFGQEQVSFNLSRVVVTSLNY